MSVSEGTRKVGRMGERTFDLWAAQANLSCNDSRGCDENGWDFLVEFPHSIGKSTADLSKAAYECKVQVKATDTLTNSWSIKLSNLIRLCTTPLPIFFMIIKFDGEDNAVEALVRHVDSELITEVLEKVHQLRQETPNIELHKIEHTITFNKDGALPELNGHGLKKKLLSYIGEDFNEYCRKKENHIASTGYEDGYKKINFSTKGKDQLINLVDSLLGNYKAIDATNISITDQRFGILDQNTVEQFENVVLAISNVSCETAKIKYRADTYSPSISFDVKIYGNPLYNALPDDLKKIRIEHDYFELEINPELKLSQYTFHFDKINKIAVKNFLDILNFYDSLTTKENSPTLEIIRPNGVSFSLKISPIEKDIDYSSQIIALKNLTKILDHFDISETIQITYDELSRLAPNIIEFAQLIRGLAVKLVVIKLDNIKFDESKTCLYISPFFLTIGGYLLIEFFSMKGKGLLNSDNIEIHDPETKFEKRIILEKENLTNSEEMKKEILNQMFHISEKYNDEYLTICEAI